MSDFTHHENGAYHGKPQHSHEELNSGAQANTGAYGQSSTGGYTQAQSGAGSQNAYGAYVQPGQQSQQGYTTSGPVYGQAGQPYRQGGWEFVNGAWRPAVQTAAAPAGGPAAPQPPRKKRGAGKVLGIIAIVLVCALAGFGGGYAAVALNGQQNPSVIYRAAEGNGMAASIGSLSDVAELAGQSVVSIITENVVTDYFMGGRIVSGAGSGVILTADGYIITNHHVIDGARNISVALPDGSEHAATLVGSDAETDVAVLKINAENLVPATIGDSGALRVGETCLAIGNPMGTLGGTVTDGIISALDRRITISEHTMTLLQMSAAVSPGNSGGGLFNARGELIGVVNAKSGGDDTEGLGFAIPVNTAVEVAQQLIEGGQIVRPALGVSVNTISTEQQMAEYGVSEPGVYVAAITPGSAAEKAGLQVGDRIDAANGQAIESGDALAAMIAQLKVGDSLNLQITRGGESMEVTATLGDKARL